MIRGIVRQGVGGKVAFGPGGLAPIICDLRVVPSKSGAPGELFMIDFFPLRRHFVKISSEYGLLQVWAAATDTVTAEINRYDQELPKSSAGQSGKPSL